MPRPHSSQYADPRQVINIRSSEVADVLEVNPDYLVVRRRDGPTAQYFIPRYAVTLEETGWRLDDEPDLPTWERWLTEPIGSRWTPSDGERVLIDAQRRAATERNLTRVIEPPERD